jgi:acetyl-CoA carboxylase carboxyltransferase component
LKARFGKVAVTGLARLDGRCVGIVANNPLVKGGALDTEACEKITSFLVLCDSFNIPVLTFVDTPGFVIGAEAERRRAPGKIMNMMNALALMTVPKLSVILRKSYGQAYLNMGGGRIPTSSRPGEVDGPGLRREDARVDRRPRFGASSHEQDNEAGLASI